MKALKTHIYKIIGNTYFCRKELKEYGGVWNSEIGCWYLKADEDHPIIWSINRHDKIKAEILENDGLEYYDFLNEQNSCTWSVGCYV